MTIFKFLGPGGPADPQDGFHVFSAITLEPAGVTTALSPGGGAIVAAVAPAVLELPVPAGLTYSRIAVWWRVVSGGAGLLTVRVLVNGVPIYTNAALDGTSGPGLVLSALINAPGPTALNDLVRVEIDNAAAAASPTDIFVRLDYTRA